MSETSWLVSAEPDEMLILLDPIATRRKLRLFCCACVRRVWTELAGANVSRQAVEVAEAFADGQATEQSLETLSVQAEAVIQGTARQTHKNARRAAAWCVSVTMDAISIGRSVGWAAAYAHPRPKGAERLAQVQVLRDIFGNPFRPALELGTLPNSDGLLLAQSMYDKRAFDAMPVLGDTLEEAGCSNQDILSHSRGPGPHFRGCWVVDLVLGKE
jgi:hypothetical protein